MVLELFFFLILIDFFFVLKYVFQILFSYKNYNFPIWRPLTIFKRFHAFIWTNYFNLKLIDYLDNYFNLVLI